MKILYLRTASFQCDPHVGSILQYAEQKEHEVQVFDYFIANPDIEIINQVTSFEPQWVIWLGVCGSVYQPKPETFKAIRNLGIKTVMVCPEACHPDWDRVIKEFHAADSFDLIVNLDGTRNWDHRGKGITTLAIFDQRPYPRKTPAIVDRPIDVGFCGGIGFEGTMRRRLIEHFKSIKSLKFVEFPFKEACGTYQQYSDFLMSCKVIINPASSSNEDFKHVKGRVIEAGLAGCALVEQVGSPIRDWFSPLTHIWFSDPSLAETACVHLITHPQHAQKMADQLSKEVRKKYSPLVLWNKILKYDSSSASVHKP